MAPRFREPLVDGIFYPAEHDELVSLLRRLITETESPASSGDAILSPSASYTYAGRCMTASYKSVAGKDPERVLIIGAGQHAQPNAASLAESEAFNTPLGSAWVDSGVTTRLGSRALELQAPIVFDDIAHIEEHCIETQLPFIQYLFPGTRIIPILVGPTEASRVPPIADSLRDGLGAGFAATLFVLASNLTGYQDRQQARREGLRYTDCLLQLQWESVLAADNRFSIGEAGLSAAAVFMALLGRDHRGELLCRANSADFSGDPGTTIEYGSICYRNRHRSGRHVEQSDG